MGISDRIQIEKLRGEIAELNDMLATTTDPIRRKAIEKMIEKKQEELIQLEIKENDTGAKVGEAVGGAVGEFFGGIMTGIISPIDDILNHGGNRDVCKMKADRKRMGSRGKNLVGLLGSLLGKKRK